jgi:hypothetical protein
VCLRQLQLLAQRSRQRPELLGDLAEQLIDAALPLLAQRKPSIHPFQPLEHFGPYLLQPNHLVQLLCEERAAT